MSNVHVLYSKFREGREILLPVNVYMHCDDDSCKGHMECIDPHKPYVEGETLYIHQCTQCNNEADFDEVFPHIEYTTFDELRKLMKEKYGYETPEI